MWTRSGARPGIVDVATSANVSPATVSRYFNTPDIVRYDTKKRIEAAITKLGYVRNRAARSVNVGKTGCVGIVVPTIDNAIFSEMLQEFSSALAVHGRTMLIAAHGYDLGREEVLVNSLLEQRVDALALIGLEHTKETLRLINRHGLPAVFVWNHSRRSPQPCIGVDNREAGRTATEYLLSLGHREILLAFGEERGNDRAADRKKGALEAIQAATQRARTCRQISCPYDIQKSKEQIREILLAPDGPTAVLAGNDVIAQGALFAAMSLGLKVPDDLSVVGIGDFRGSSAIEPGLTTLRIPARRIGRSSADALVEMIEWPDAKIHHNECLPVELIVRGSTAPPRRRRRTTSRGEKKHSQGLGRAAF